jgi:methyl-accepting chemotaxis protein
MVLVFSVMSAIMLLIASSAGYFFTKERFSENIERQMTASINGHINKLDGWLVAKREEVEITAGTIQASGNGKAVLNLLQGAKSMDKDLNDIYFAPLDGKLLSGSGWIPPADFDSRTRSWYKGAMQVKKTIFTAPYVDAESKQMAVAIALPCQSASGQIMGVLGADILLPKLEENIKEINLNGHGSAFIVDKTGVILAHSEDSLISKNLYELKDGEIAKTVKEVMGKEQGVVKYQDDGKDMLMVYKQIPSTQWLLGITVEQAIAFQPLAYLRWLFIGIAVCSILLVVGVTFVMTRRITRPLEVLTQQVELLAQGDLTVQATVSGHDEFSKLAIGFNKMAPLKPFYSLNRHGVIFLRCAGDKVCIQIAGHSQPLAKRGHACAPGTWLNGASGRDRVPPAFGRDSPIMRQCLFQLAVVHMLRSEVFEHFRQFSGIDRLLHFLVQIYLTVGQTDVPVLE